MKSPRFQRTDKWMKIMISSRSKDKIDAIINKYELSKKITEEKEYSNHLWSVTVRLNDYCGSQQMISEFDVDGNVYVTELHTNLCYSIHNYHSKQFFLKNIVLAGDVTFSSGFSTIFETFSNYFEDILIKVDNETSKELLEIKQFHLYRSIIEEASRYFLDIIKSGPSTRGRGLDRLILWMNLFISKLNARKISIRKFKDFSYHALMMFIDRIN